MRPRKFLARAARWLVLGLAGCACAAHSAGGGIGAGIGSLLGGTLGGVGGTLDGTLGGLGNTLNSIGRHYLVPTEGTESFSGTMSYQGLARNWIGIRPAGAPAGAPMLILLHPSGTTPEEAANIARIGRLAQLYGAWIYLPESPFGKWNDDPAKSSGRDDSGFLASLVQTAIDQDRVNAKEVYVVGYSNGGFMAQRFACEHSALVAGLATVAATLHDSLRSDCSFSHPMPVLMFNGTADPIVPYTGLPTLPGAKAAIKFFAGMAGCTTTASTTTRLADGGAGGLTSVDLTHYSACPATGRADLYSINGGGHTWPGAPSVFGLALGATTHDIDATMVLWQTLIMFASP